MGNPALAREIRGGLLKGGAAAIGAGSGSLTPRSAIPRCATPRSAIPVSDTPADAAPCGGAARSNTLGSLGLPALIWWHLVDEPAQECLHLSDGLVARGKGADAGGQLPAAPAGIEQRQHQLGNGGGIEGGSERGGQVTEDSVMHLPSELALGRQVEELHTYQGTTWVRQFQGAAHRGVDSPLR